MLTPLKTDANSAESLPPLKADANSAESLAPLKAHVVAQLMSSFPSFAKNLSVAMRRVCVHNAYNI